ncbi:pancreatic triacylglycerol lipase-like [Pieris napi]|uniref:pancreatic triacylglycerol lipase-like n=1 Tax=Pieris napi TaxID=78633 RepID=UPI001FBA52A8|nr:pancreatic triacylglycerol lipase-like [Pieris napi]
MYAVFKCAIILCVALPALGFPMAVNDVVFHLFTRANPTTSEPLLASVASISQSRHFSNSRRTVFAIHNYGENVSGNFIAFVAPALLAAEDVNVVAVDWRSGSFGYVVGLANVPQLGTIVASFANILFNSFGYNSNNVRIVGVGLGAHAAGVAARKMNANIPHIFALDPSLVGWTENPDKLSTRDATFVEVLHTTAGRYGYDRPLGHLDFYANGGVTQPMCGDLPSCSHAYSYVYYAESIAAEAGAGAKFVGTQCASYEQATLLQCTGTGSATFGGIAAKTSVSGIYTFLTNVRPPFAQG